MLHKFRHDAETVATNSQSVAEEAIRARHVLQEVNRSRLPFAEHGANAIRHFHRPKRKLRYEEVVSNVTRGRCQVETRCQVRPVVIVHRIKPRAKWPVAIQFMDKVELPESIARAESGATSEPCLEHDSEGVIDLRARTSDETDQLRSRELVELKEDCDDHANDAAVTKEPRMRVDVLRHMHSPQCFASYRVELDLASSMGFERL
jgi:hypothetical protein